MSDQHEMTSEEMQAWLATLDETDTTPRSKSSWRPIDLTAALAGDGPPPPQLLRRDDGVSLLYRRRVHWLSGDSETLKSWCAQFAVAQVIQDGGNVLYLDFEDDEHGVVGRLTALGVPSPLLHDHLSYMRPDEALMTRDQRITPGGLDLADAIKDRSYRLCIIDGVTEAMTVEGLEINDNVDIATWMRRLPKLIASTGPAVAVLDHLVKDRTGGAGRFAIGGQHKLAGVDGAAYMFAGLRPLSRPTGSDPVEGAAKITVVKDRPGWVRGHSKNDHVATLEITAYPDGGITSRLLAPSEATEAPPMELSMKILDYLVVYPGSSKTGVETGVQGKGPTIRAALHWMAEKERGWVRVEKVGQSHQHFITEEGQKVLDS